MVSDAVIKEIDRTIQEVWRKNIAKDYKNYYLLKEDSLKTSFYYHLRRKLARLLEENHLRIYTEHYFPDLGYRADMAIVEIDTSCGKSHLKDWVTQIVAVIELKYAGGNSERAGSWVKSDIPKIRSYIRSGIQCLYYFAVIYETECDYLNWLDKRSTNHWASGRVTELDAGLINGVMEFEVHPW